MNNIDKSIFSSYETVESAFNNDLRDFCADGRTMRARALKGESYYFKSSKTGKKYDISPEECRILNLFYDTLNALNEAQRVDNMMVYYNGNVWWFERAELRRKVIEMVNGYIDAFEAWLNEKIVTETEEVKNEETVKAVEKNEETVSDEKSSNDECEAAVVEYKLIEGFEDYMVSSDGKVFSLKRGKMKEMKPRLKKGGYLDVLLCSNGQYVHKYIHRLVARAFISNPDNKPQVNHKDEVKTNNCVDNLEWCTSEYNNNFGSRGERVAKANINHPDLSVPVVCLETGEVYPSVHEAERQTGVYNSHISDCLNGKQQTAGGYHWARFIKGDNQIYD